MTNRTPGYLTVEGMPAATSRDGYIRLDLTPGGAHYVEVPQSGIVISQEITSERVPFVGQTVTQLGLQEGAPIEFTSRYQAPSSEALEAALDNSDLVMMHSFFPGVGDWFTPGLLTRKWCGFP
jgi:hypothetical protein